MSKSYLIKSLFLEWVDTTSMHGLPNIFRTKFSSIRILWIISFVISNSLCFAVIAKSILDYFQFEVVTKIRVLEKDAVTFPAITICSSNSFVTDSAITFVKDKLAENNITDLSNSSFLASKFPSKSNQLYMNYLMTRYFIGTHSKSRAIRNDQKKTFGFSFDKVFLSCFYSSADCDESDWIWYYDTIYGNCFRFNTGLNSKGEKTEIKKAIQPGIYSGLTLEIYVGVPNNQATLSTYNGAHIFIDDNQFSPLPSGGLDIQPGTQTSLALERIVSKQLPKPYSDCVQNLDNINSFDSDYYKKIFKYKKTYRQIDCFYLYIQTEIFKKCGCIDQNFFEFEENAKPCNSIKDLQCSFMAYNDLTKTNYKSKIKHLCPLECESVKYKFVKSDGKYPSFAYANDLKNSQRVRDLFDNRTNITVDELRENILGLNIYLDEIKQTEISESESLSWVSLIAGIGGTLGLFLGISVLSLVEFLDIFLSLIFSVSKTKVENF